MTTSSVIARWGEAYRNTLLNSLFLRADTVSR